MLTLAPAPVPSPIFRGDSEHLLQQLVDICNQPPKDLPAGYVGRELQPFVFDDVPLPDVSRKSLRRIASAANKPSSPANNNSPTGPKAARGVGPASRLANRSPRASTPGSPASPKADGACVSEQRARCAVSPDAKVALKSSVTSRGSFDSMARSPAATVAAQRTPAATFRSLGSRADVEALLAGVQANASPVAAGLAGCSACPGFFSSPRPEVLPMPTSGLLKRATVKA